MAARPQYFIHCKNMLTGAKELLMVGDAYGNEANTKWVVKARSFSKSGGPFQWVHRYDRCPASNTCASITNGNPLFDRAEPDTPEGCCDNLEPGMYCQPSCQRWIQNDETALPSDTGFYWKFQSDPVTGRPSGCPGFDNEKFQIGKYFKDIIFLRCS